MREGGGQGRGFVSLFPIEKQAQHTLGIYQQAPVTNLDLHYLTEAVVTPPFVEERKLYATCLFVYSFAKQNPITPQVENQSRTSGRKF